MWNKILAFVRDKNTWAQNAHFFSAYAIVITPWAIWRSEKWTWIAAAVVLVWAAWKEIWFDKYVEHPGPQSKSDWDDLGFYCLGLALAIGLFLLSK